MWMWVCLKFVPSIVRRICPIRVFVRLKALSFARSHSHSLRFSQFCLFFSLCFFTHTSFSPCCRSDRCHQLTSHCEKWSNAMCVACFYYLFHPFSMSSILFSILYFISLLFLSSIWFGVSVSGEWCESEERVNFMCHSIYIRSDRKKKWEKWNDARNSFAEEAKKKSKSNTFYFLLRRNRNALLL